MLLLIVSVFLLLGCTTSFATEDRDTWGDTEEDTTDVADSPDLDDDSLEVPDVVEDDGGGVSDTEGDTEEDTEDPCVYYPMWYRDQDMDGWGRDDLTVCFPTQPEGYVASGGDCCDVRPEVHPGVEEWADEPYTCPDESWDYDCDGDEELRVPAAPSYPCAILDTACMEFCNGFETEEECLGRIWWSGGTPGCGESQEGVNRCFWEPTVLSCTAVTYSAYQQCR